MRNIAKGPEPSCLAAHRRTPHSSYNNLPVECKDELKRRMRREQGGLCCYCMSRVTDENGHIEHWHPQSQSRGKRDKRDLDYANLLLVCAGGANHCDVAKGDKQLKFNPADSRHNVESRIRYHANGRIECSDDAEFDNQIQKTLNLNAAHLVENRRVVGDDARRRAGECTSLLALNNLRKRALKANRDGALKPFCMVSVYFIDKKIRKLQAQKQHEKR